MKGAWIEPFCGSCVVALNVQPEKAILADTNTHIIKLYHNIQNEEITSYKVKHFLEQEGSKLLQEGESYYYQVRERFNESGDSLDFLFLNRSCFNGVMRFNKRGKFNVPFGHHVDRFRPAYVTKIVNQVKAFRTIVANSQWEFRLADFRLTLDEATRDDFLYVDPPYIGRHTDYFNAWNETDEEALIDRLKQSPGRFLLSTWHHNRYRSNKAIEKFWHQAPFSIRTLEHFYHVGSTEDLRNAMTEALIANFKLPHETDESKPRGQQLSLFGD
jgi:DNA adenine methylase